MIGYKEVSVDEFNRINGGGMQDVHNLISRRWKFHDSAICIVSSNKYVAFASVTLASIKANANSKNKYDIVVLSTDMQACNISKLFSLADDNISIRVFDITKEINGRSFYTWAHFTPNTYYRLLIPDLFKQYKKVLYLDSDVVVNADLSELVNIDVCGYYLAAAYDTRVVSYCTRNPPLEQREYNRTVLGLKSPEQYYQCGVALYNITEINESFGEGYMIQQASRLKLRWLDQDVVNMIFANRILCLDNTWNVMVANNPNDVDEYYLPNELRVNYYKARMRPSAVHYVGQSIPCITNTPDMDEYFWQYARLSPFYETLLCMYITKSLTISKESESSLAMRIESAAQLKSYRMFREWVKNKIGRIPVFMRFKRMLARTTPNLHGKLSRIYHSLYGLP